MACPLFHAILIMDINRNTIEIKRQVYRLKELEANDNDSKQRCINSWNLNAGSGILKPEWFLTGLTDMHSTGRFNEVNVNSISIH